MMFLIVVLVALWFLGNISIPGLSMLQHIILFNLNGRSVSLWDTIIFCVILWAVNVLPSPMRQIGWLLVVLWLLGLVGIIAIVNFTSVIVWAVIIGLVLAALKLI